VDQHIEPALLGDHSSYRLLGGFVGADVELHGSKVDIVLRRVLLGVGRGSRVPARDVAHSGVHDVAGVGQRASGESAEATRGTTDQNYLAHDGFSSKTYAAEPPLV
jgi:hypothetical protein